MQEKYRLWSLVVRYKHVISDRGFDTIMPKNDASNLWKGLNDAKEILVPTTTKQPITNRNTKF